MFDIPFTQQTRCLNARVLPDAGDPATCLVPPRPVLPKSHKKSLSRVSGGWNSPLGPADTSVSSFARLGFWLEQDANSDHRKSGSCDWSIVYQRPDPMPTDQQEHSWCRGRVTLVLTHV